MLEGECTYFGSLHRSHFHPKSQKHFLSRNYLCIPSYKHALKSKILLFNVKQWKRQHQVVFSWVGVHTWILDHFDKLIKFYCGLSIRKLAYHLLGLILQGRRFVSEWVVKICLPSTMHVYKPIKGYKVWLTRLRRNNLILLKSEIGTWFVFKRCKLLIFICHRWPTVIVHHELIRGLSQRLRVLRWDDWGSLSPGLWDEVWADNLLFFWGFLLFFYLLFLLNSNYSLCRVKFMQKLIDLVNSDDPLVIHV